MTGNFVQLDTAGCTAECSSKLLQTLQIPSISLDASKSCKTKSRKISSRKYLLVEQSSYHMVYEPCRARVQKLKTYLIHATLLSVQRKVSVNEKMTAKACRVKNCFRCLSYLANSRTASFANARIASFANSGVALLNYLQFTKSASLGRHFQRNCLNCRGPTPKLSNPRLVRQQMPSLLQAEHEY